MTTPPPSTLKWSVMIPAYGKGTYLEQTLRSVLEQDPGPEQMQIAVVENPSGNDEIKEIVERVAGKRAEYHCNLDNLGMVGNWNRCIELARGELVHILHDDDWVLPGFYTEIERLSANNPQCALYATRTHIQNTSKNTTNKISPAIHSLANGAKAPQALYYGNKLYCPSVAIRNEFYKNNRFLKEFTAVPDWEMWVRAISQNGGCVSKLPLTTYRMHKNNITHQLISSARNLTEMLQLIPIFKAYNLPGFNPQRLINQIRKSAEHQMAIALVNDDQNGYKKNRIIWQSIAPRYRWLRLAIIYCKIKTQKLITPYINFA